MTQTEPEQPGLDLERVAEAIARRGLTVPAVMLLELHRPLAPLASQAMVVGWPLLAPLLGLRRFDEVRDILADRERFDAFVTLLGAKAAAAEGQE